MKSSSYLSLALLALLSVPALEARAALYEGVIGGSVSSDSTRFPFGTPVTVRFSLDTDQAPAPYVSTDPAFLEVGYSESGNRAATWLSIEVQIGTLIRSIQPADSLLFSQIRADGDGDILALTAYRCDPGPGGSCAASQMLDLRVNSADFGAGDPFWTDVDVVPTYLSEGGYSENLPGSLFGVDLRFSSLSFHPVPEPAACALLALLALPLWRRR